MHNHSDALVFFGATGDLAYKKIFPALQNLIQHGPLDVPVIGVAKAGWKLAQLQERRETALSSTVASTKRRLPSSSVYCGTSTVITTIQRRSPNCARPWMAGHPLHYLAIPPSLFATVIEDLGKVRQRRQRARCDRKTVRTRRKVRPRSEQHPLEYIR